MNIIRGETYQNKKQRGSCYVCGKRTNHWIDNDNDYFCLSKSCFYIRQLNDLIEAVNNRVDCLIEKLQNINGGN